MPIDPNVSPVVCTREEDLPRGTVVPPQVRMVPCVSCGKRVGTSPSSRDLIARGIGQPVCYECVEANAHLWKGEQVWVMTADGLRDLETYRSQSGHN